MKNPEIQKMRVTQTQMNEVAQHQQVEFESLMRDSGVHIDTPWGKHPVGRSLTATDGKIIDEIINGGHA